MMALPAVILACTSFFSFLRLCRLRFWPPVNLRNTFACSPEIIKQTFAGKNFDYNAWKNRFLHTVYSGVRFLWPFKGPAKKILRTGVHKKWSLFLWTFLAGPFTLKVHKNRNRQYLLCCHQIPTDPITKSNLVL